MISGPRRCRSSPVIGLISMPCLLASVRNSAPFMVTSKARRTVSERNGVARLCMRITAMAEGFALHLARKWPSRPWIARSGYRRKAFWRSVAANRGVTARRAQLLQRTNLQ
jgi:hypothetical protein